MYDLLAADIGGHGRLAMARGPHPVDQDNRIDSTDSIMPLSSVSVATAVELFASLLVRYKFVATSMHSKAPDKMIRRERMVRRDITLDISRRPARPFQRRRHLPSGFQRMNFGEAATS